MWWGPNEDRAIDDLARTARWITGVFLVVLLLLITEGRPWDLFGVGLYTSAFYDAQAEAFLRFRLDVPWEVAVIEGFEIDGRTYLYFGPFLALVRLPFAWIPGIDGRLTGISLLIGGAALAAGAFALLAEARLRLRGRTAESASSGERWRTAAFMGAVLASPVLFLGAERTVYHETEMWGGALAVWTAAWVLRSLRRPGRRHVVLAGLAAAACALTRISVGLGAVAVVGVLVVVLWTRSERRLALTGAALAGGGVAVHMALNYARFSSLVGVPFERQTLTLVSPDRAAWFEANGGSFFGVQFVPTNLVHYLRPDTLVGERLLPFVRFGDRASELFGADLETSSRAGSLTATAPVLVVLAIVGVVLIVRRRAWDWLAVTTTLAVGAVPVLAIGFIAHRYLADLLPMFIVPAAIGTWVGLPARWIAPARLGLTAALLVSLWVNAALGWWVQSFREPWFTDLRYRLDGAVFGGAPPSVVRVEEGPMPRDGLVGIAGECDALYIGDGDEWRPLEHPLGDRRLLLVVELPAEGERPLVGGPDWTVSIAVDKLGEAGAAGDATVVVDLPDGTRDRGGIESAGSVDEPLEVEVLADPTLRLLQVKVDGRTTFARLLAGPDLPMYAFEGVQVVDRESPGGGAPVCERVLARLGG